MSPRRELFAFSMVLAALVTGFFHESLVGGKVLSSADVLLVSASFRDDRAADYEPANRLLMDPVLQFQPWIEFNRSMIRQGRLPLWNGRVGCGAPHLANGQSAVFDPFQVIAYLGTVPDAYAWMAAARLWVAGLGMFLLARSWGLGPWGRWFSGVSYPFCGFLVVWLLYPVTNVAIWMPWLFWAGDRVLSRPGARKVGVLGLVTGAVLLGGHVQTSAHVLLAAGLFAIWRVVTAARRAVGHHEVSAFPPPSDELSPCEPSDSPVRGLSYWAVGIGLGILLAAVEVVPLGVYLSRSPVWEDRERERASPWTLTRPRVVGAVCTAFPYAFGSQRRGHPHLGRAFGVDNLNETAGGFAGLATLIWLAPLAWSVRRADPRVRFLGGLAVFGLLGACGLPPVDNVLRALPVLGVTDNRRLSLWVAFSLVLLAGFGLDRLHESARTPGVRLWVGLALVFLGGAMASPKFEPILQHRATAHYARAASQTEGADPLIYQARADRQVRATLRFIPLYFAMAGAHLLMLAGLATALRRRKLSVRSTQAALMSLTMLDLLGFGYGLNPAIARRDDRPPSPVVDSLRREVKQNKRIIALGEEMPPNAMMRYGLSDARNYDSVELTRNLAHFAPLYEPGPRARTSRREITWNGVLRAQDRLKAASVQAIVSASPPPDGAFPKVDQIGSIWIAQIESQPWATFEKNQMPVDLFHDSGMIHGTYELHKNDRLIVREMFDPGWRATVDGRPVGVQLYQDAFLAVSLPAGRHRLDIWYDPPEVWMAIGASLFALISLVFALTVPSRFRSTRIIAEALGRTQAVELESDECSSPPNHRGIKR